ncbi:branched-chain amino acid ABC transporter permease [Oscillospiraceae bacterium OttesenSCG-928-G22]|nr:branched-chain amino acid ABC transporter permease [Oscillospiraceae bacterium OttesenSCG-928-G22]
MNAFLDFVAGFTNAYWVGVFTNVGIMMIAIMGVSILTGFTGLFSMGHAGFMALGAYGSAIFTKAFDLPFYLGVPVGILIATAVGLIIGFPTLRLKGDYFTIATLGFGEVVKLAVENAQELTGGARGTSDIPKFAEAGTAERNTLIAFFIVWITAIVVIFLLKHFLNSRQGRNCVAIREEEMAATSIGVNTTKHKLLALGISCALCGLAGAYLAHYMHYLHPNMFNNLKSNELIMTVILGGRGSLTGTIIASLVLVPLPEILRINAAQEWRMVIYGLLVVVVIIFRPSGLMGNRELTWQGTKRFFKKLFSKKTKATGGANNG